MVVVQRSHATSCAVVRTPLEEARMQIRPMAPEVGAANRNEPHMVGRALVVVLGVARTTGEQLRTEHR